MTVLIYRKNQDKGLKKSRQDQVTLSWKCVFNFEIFDLSLCDGIASLNFYKLVYIQRLE